MSELAGTGAVKQKKIPPAHRIVVIANSVTAGALKTREESLSFQMSRRPTFPTTIYTGFTGLNAVSPASSYPLETWT